MSFYYFDSVLCTEVLSFAIVQFVVFFCQLCFWCPIQEIIANSNVIEAFHLSFKSFRILALTFRTLIHFMLFLKFLVLFPHFESIFVYHER